MTTHTTPIITAQADVQVDMQSARAWFLTLKTHPERYQFATHAGFRFTQGSFGEIGARFRTQEHFHGLQFTLRFILTQVEATRFQFRLEHLPIWGAFTLDPQGAQSTRLQLDVGGNTSVGRCLLRCPPVYQAVKRQIQGEVAHIKTSMETIDADERRRDTSQEPEREQ